SQTQTGYLVKGGQTYRACDLRVEGDWSGAAFFLSAGALGGRVACEGLDPDSLQGDRAIAALLARFGARVDGAGDTVTVSRAPLVPLAIEASDIPDLVPVLAVVAAFAQGDTVITGAARLRIKESDRLLAVQQLLTGLGGSAEQTGDGLIIHGGAPLLGGVADSFGDHRIAMAAAVAALGCANPVTIHGAECVSKSYPGFFLQLQRLGGRYDELNMG
ncbi:MAG: 3-phosphoshikimate 1-carboxyvinyltransferase, partial [Acetanaerobacterium sp.]